MSSPHTAVAGPTIAGIHHLRYFVGDVDASLRFFQQVFSATRIAALDHVNDEGTLFAIMIDVPGLPVPVQLRYAPDRVRDVAGYEPITFAVQGYQDLEEWGEHLDRVQVAHSPIKKMRAGHAIEFASPDGAALRLYTLRDEPAAP